MFHFMGVGRINMGCHIKLQLSIVFTICYIEAWSLYSVLLESRGNEDFSGFFYKNHYFLIMIINRSSCWPSYHF